MNSTTVSWTDTLDMWHIYHLQHFILIIYHFMTTTTPNIHTSIIPQDTTPQITLRPIQSIDTIVEAYNEYNRLKERLLTPSDYQTIKGKTCIKKSGFRKLACAFGISTEITRENRIDFENYFIYEVTCRATSPNWRFVEACASCASNEKDFAHLENDVRATAQTRASNRAISDLIGWGEVSADELDDTKVLPKVEDKTLPKNTFQPYHETPEGKKHYESIKNKNPAPTQVQEELENSEPHMKGIVHKNNTTYETQELMTVKQKQYLIKLIEIKYPDEQTRAKLYNRLLSLTKNEARSAIQKMLA